MRIEICCDRPEGLLRREVEVPSGARVAEALAAAGVREDWIEADRVGIHGRLQSLDTLLAEGDRVELYRPLHLDPKARRRLRAEQALPARSSGRTAAG